MAQVSFSRKQLESMLQDLSVSQIKRQMPRSLRRNGKLLLAGLAISVLLAWNWLLVLATAAGAGSMALAYFLLEADWRSWWLRWQHFCQRSQGKFSLAVGSGGLVALSTYIAASIWSEAENRWLAVGTLLQGLTSLLTLLLLAWHAFSQGEQQEESKFERLLGGLTADDSLKRLIAVRQLTKLAHKTGFSPLHQAQIEEYFRLMLLQESEPAVREAILDSLQNGKAMSLPTKSQPGKPLQMPVNLPLPRKAVAGPLRQEV